MAGEIRLGFRLRLHPASLSNSNASSDAGAHARSEAVVDIGATLNAQAAGSYITYADDRYSLNDEQAFALLVPQRRRRVRARPDGRRLLAGKPDGELLSCERFRLPEAAVEYEHGNSQAAG